MATKPRKQRAAPIGGKWSEEEDKALTAIVTERGPKNWKEISKILGPMRTDVQCLHRWNKVLKPGLHKGPWKEEEDNIVRDTVMRHGVGKVKWSAIAALVSIDFNHKSQHFSFEFYQFLIIGIFIVAYSL